MILLLQIALNKEGTLMRFFQKRQRGRGKPPCNPGGSAPIGNGVSDSPAGALPRTRGSLPSGLRPR